MPKSRSRKSRASRSRSRSVLGAKSRHSRRRRSRSRSVSGASRRSNSKNVRVPRGISSGRAKRLVYDGVYKKTRGGLTKDKLVENKHGKVVSKKKAAIGRALQRENPFKKNPQFMKYKGKIDSL